MLEDGLQSLPEHHIGYHGETRAELASEYVRPKLAPTRPSLPWTRTTGSTVSSPRRSTPNIVRVWVARDFRGRTGGSPGRRPDLGTHRRCPLPEARRLPALRDNRGQRSFGHVANHRLAQFAQRKRFPRRHVHNGVHRWTGVDLDRMIGSVPEASTRSRSRDFPTPTRNSVAAAAFIRLHDEVFPNTNKSAAQCCLR